MKNEIHDLAVKVEKDCQEKVKQGVLDQRNCDEMKMKVVAEKSAELCQGNKDCLKAIKKAISSGALPLKSSGVDLAWSLDNPYKSAASLDASKSSSSQNQNTQNTHKNSAVVSESKTLAKLMENIASEAKGDRGTGGDKGETVMSTFGTDKGKEILNKEILTNEVAGGSITSPSAGPSKQSGVEATQNNERLKGILKDVGISQKDLDQLKNSEPVAVKAESGQPAPSKEEVQKAINSFKKIFYGRPVDKIEGVEKYCVGTTSNLDRSIGFLPFSSSFEPFLEYFGHIRDLQNEK